MVWYTVVHRGTNAYERTNALMEFKEFFSLMKKRISDGADVPYFFKDLIAMITTVPESEWGTPKDPSTKLSKESTLRSYAKRGLTQKFAQSIVYRLSPEMFVESLTSHEAAVLELLAKDFEGYDNTVTVANVAQKLADCFIDIIRRAAGIVPKSELEMQKLRQQAFDLKSKYGDYLREETGNVCPIPGCGRSLKVPGDGEIRYVFEVGVIDAGKPLKIDNMLAFCPQCQATYSMDTNTSLTKDLIRIKKMLIASNQSTLLLDQMPLEKGIINVIRRIKKLGEKDLLDASLDPKEIRDKIDPTEYFVLYRTVKNYVDTYYVTLKKIITNADKRGEIDYDAVQDQMKAIYKRLKKARKNQLEIFEAITEKVHKISLQEEVYCQIVVAFFIAKCEVFDAIAQ